MISLLGTFSTDKQYLLPYLFITKRTSSAGKHIQSCQISASGSFPEAQDNRLASCQRSPPAKPGGKERDIMEKNDKPKYVELYRILKEKILNGDYPTGSNLPTENELVQIYQMSKTTVRHAVGLLREKGLVEVRQGSGTKILGVPEKKVEKSKYHSEGKESNLFLTYYGGESSEVTNTAAAIDMVPAQDLCASFLKVKVGTPVYRLQRLQRVGGQIFGYMVNYLNPETFPDLHNTGDIFTDLYHFLHNQYGVDVRTSDEYVIAKDADFKEAQYLQVEIGTPLLLLRRYVVDGSGNPVEFCETTIRPDVAAFTVHTEYSLFDKN